MTDSINSAVAISRHPMERFVRWGFVLGAVALGVALFQSGGEEGWTPARVAQIVSEAGSWGVVGFVVAFAVLQPLGISGHVFCLAAVALWPPWEATLWAWTGAVGSSLVSMAIARWVAHDFIRKRLPSRAQAWERKLVNGGWWALFTLRLITFTMHAAQYVVGVLPIPLSRVLTATALGYLPTVLLDVWLGGEFLRLLGWGD